MVKFGNNRYFKYDEFNIHSFFIAKYRNLPHKIRSSLQKLEKFYKKNLVKVSDIVMFNSLYLKNLKYYKFCLLSLITKIYLDFKYLYMYNLNYTVDVEMLGYRI